MGLPVPENLIPMRVQLLPRLLPRERGVRLRQLHLEKARGEDAASRQDGARLGWKLDVDSRHGEALDRSYVGSNSTI